MCQSPTERHIKLSIQSFLAAQWIDPALCKLTKSTVIVMLSAARQLWFADPQTADRLLYANPGSDDCGQNVERSRRYGRRVRRRGNTIAQARYHARQPYCTYGASAVLMSLLLRTAALAELG